MLRGTSKKSDLLDLFRLPRNLGLKLSLDNKLGAKRIGKNDDKYPIFDVKVGQKICLGALFSARSFCTGVLLVNALFTSNNTNKNMSAY